MAKNKIDWLEWSSEAFQKAQKENKLILMDISAVWCHWCHVMDKTTYSNPQVIRIVNERFIPIKVDSDRRPDIQERYLLGGWPTTAFLLPSGLMMSGSTFMPPEAMVNKLMEVDALYRNLKPVVEKQAEGTQAEIDVDRWQAERPVKKLDEGIIESIETAVSKTFDPVNGGFGTSPKFPYPDAVRLALLSHGSTRDPRMKEIITGTLDAMTGILDPVWGGFYRYSVDPSWKTPHYEKLLYVQAAIMDNYLEAYRAVENSGYLETARRIKEYTDAFLSDAKNGGFYGSQDADVRRLNSGEEFIPGEQYFIKDDAQRRTIGIPVVDKTIYTDWNGQMCSAYLSFYQTDGDEHARDFAVKTIDRIIAISTSNDRMCHYHDGHPHVTGLLADQVRFSKALIDTYQVTGERKYLDHAEKLAGFMKAGLQDVVDGGFYYQIDDPHAMGALADRYKPFDENAAAAEMLIKLHHLTGENAYFEMAENTLKSIDNPEIEASILGAGFAIALDAYFNPPTHIVISGYRDDPETEKMRDISLKTYIPRKLVQTLDPRDGVMRIGDTEYPAHEKTAAYVCHKQRCTPPIKNAEELEKTLKEIKVKG